MAIGRHRVIWGLSLLAIVAGLTKGAVGQNGPAAGDEFQQSVAPVLAKNCVGCHSDRLRTGDLSLQQFQDQTQAVKQPEIWRHVLEKVTSGQMPPRPRAPLSADEAAALTAWIRKLPGMSDVPGSAPVAEDPGRVTARRLNRTEYNNTIRDLLGVTLRPADEFPVDDSGYGFDNIGDVLSLSPMLMEKYMQAARVVARAAVFGESYPDKPGQLINLQPKKMQDDVPARGNETPYSMRGALYTTYHFPVDGEYEFQWRYGNYRGRGKPVGPGRPFAKAEEKAAPIASADIDPDQQPPAQGAAPRRPPTDAERAKREEKLRTAFPPIQMAFSIDGNVVATDDVVGDGNYNYAHGDNIARVKVAAGDHELRVSWPSLAAHPNPFGLINADGRQELFIDYMRIVGPFKPSTAPPPGFQKIFICGSPGRYTPACIKQIVANLATRAYRRPATSDETARLVALVTRFQKTDSVEHGVQMAIESLLVSPNFLFRIERDQPAASASPAKAESYPIGDYELASRLSYFLWSSMPDAVLFKAASEGRLQNTEELHAQVDRMLADPKAISLVDNFGEQWLNLRLMDRTKPDSEKFLAVDDELLDAMREETRHFLRAVFSENRSILDFVDGRYTFVNGPLARYYGIPGVNTEQFQRVDLDGVQRSGLLTQASIMTISSYATRTSPVLRGKWVLDNLLGAAPPPPPADIPPLQEQGLGTAVSLRERLQQHRASPRCAVCHDQMDPIGFSLENYDAAGAWRTKDGEFPLDTTGTLPDGRAVNGAIGLKKMLRDDAPAFARHFTDRLMTYALGRGLERGDRALVDRIVVDLGKQDYRFNSLVAAIVDSRPFRMRSRSGGLE